MAVAISPIVDAALGHGEMAPKENEPSTLVFTVANAPNEEEDAEHRDAAMASSVGQTGGHEIVVGSGWERLLNTEEATVFKLPNRLVAA